MASWEQFDIEAPEFAAAIRARFTANRHHVLATLRRDGSPRVSGTEVRFYGRLLTIGSMRGAIKALDLRRDGRYALHANPGDSTMADGDAKLSGVAVEVTEPDLIAGYFPEGETDPGPFHLFELGLTEAVLTELGEGGDHLLIRSWRPGEPVRAVRRH
jgi:hypothetical protein